MLIFERVINVNNYMSTLVNNKSLGMAVKVFEPKIVLEDVRNHLKYQLEEKQEKGEKGERRKSENEYEIYRILYFEFSIGKEKHLCPLSITFFYWQLPVLALSFSRRKRDEK